MPPPPAAYATFLDQVRAVLGRRFGGGWITRSGDGSQTLNIGVVREQASDGPTIGSLAGAYGAHVRLVSVVYSLDQLQKFQSEISEAVFPRVVGGLKSPAILQYDEVSYHLTSIGIEPEENKVLITTGGRVESASSAPPQKGATIPTDIPVSAYAVNTSVPVTVMAVLSPPATPAEHRTVRESPRFSQ